MVRRGLGRSFQVTNIFPRMSVFENIRCGALWAGGYKYAFWRLINRERGHELPLDEVIRAAGQRRFRPILLTTLTTFLGLTPMILETSLQARFLIPMAISLGFGVVFATAITLLLVPCLYRILEDLRALVVQTPGTEPVQVEAGWAASEGGAQP